MELIGSVRYDGKLFYISSLDLGRCKRVLLIRRDNIDHVKLTVSVNEQGVEYLPNACKKALRHLMQKGLPNGAGRMNRSDAIRVVAKMVACALGIKEPTAIRRFIAKVQKDLDE